MRAGRAEGSGVIAVAPSVVVELRFNRLRSDLLMFPLLVRVKWWRPSISAAVLPPNHILSSFRKRSEVMVAWPNATASSHWEPEPEELQRSACVLGFIPVVYYSVLLCVGVPGTVGKPVSRLLNRPAVGGKSAHFCWTSCLFCCFDGTRTDCQLDIM